MRNQYLDYVRGVATLSVIFIHTVWWSGTSYVPHPIKLISLLFEVPVFFFLAGWSYSYSMNISKGVQNMVRLQWTYMIYIVLMCGILWFANVSLSPVQTAEWLFHVNYNSSDPLPVVMGSMWFMKVFILVSLIAMVAVRFANVNSLKAIAAVSFVLTAVFTIVKPSVKDVQLLGVSLEFIFFYLFLYLFGFLLKDVQIRWIHVLAGLAIVAGLLGVFHFVLRPEIPVKEVQRHKFPPDFIYMLTALPGILLVMKFKNISTFIGNNFFSYLGKNSIFFYFGQGISSSILFFLVPYVKEYKWFLVLPAMFVINVMLCLIISEFIKKYISAVMGSWKKAKEFIGKKSGIVS